MTVDWRALDGWGFNVFALRERDKKPIGPWGSFQTRRTTQEQLANWSRKPELNAGIACGEISGIIVLDADSAEAVADVQQRGMPMTPAVKTAKGVHWYLRWPGRRVHNFARKLPGLDLRGDGGYVVAAGSVHPSGHVYGWITSPEETLLADPPAWLMALLDDGPAPTPAEGDGSVVAGPWKPAENGNSYAEAALDKECGRVRRAAQGTRNQVLNEAAFNLGQLVGGRALDRGTVENFLLSAARDAGLPAKEAKATIGSGMKAGEAQPRTAPEPRRGPGRSPGSSAAPRAPTTPPAPPQTQERRASEADGVGDGPPSAGGGGRPERPFTPLGQRGGAYYVLSAAGEIRELSAREIGAVTGILSLTSGEVAWLLDRFPRFGKDGERLNDWHLKNATAEIMRQCARAGLWDADTPVRALGVWRHQEALLVHAGDAVLLDGVWVAAGRRIGPALYPAAPAILRPAAVPADQDTAQRVAQHLKLWPTKQKVGRTLLYGWMAAAMLGAGPRWRPHFLVSGERGTGKSSLAEYVSATLGPQTRTVNNFTEAGIRQALTNEARALVLDEAEGSTERVRKVIELLRQMSGGEGVQGLRGTVGQGAQRFTLSGSVYLSAINAPMLEPQDRSRITEIEIVPPPKDAAAAAQVTDATRWVETVSPALRARAVAGWARFNENLAVLRSVLVERGCDGRQADQLGTLLAAGAMLHNDLPLESDGAAEIVAKVEPMLFRLRSEDEEDSDPRRCFATLMTTAIDHWKGGNRSTIGGVLQAALREPGVEQREALPIYGLRVELYGVRWRDDGGADQEAPGPCLVVANRHEQLVRVFRDSPWGAGGWRRALLRLPGAREAPPLRFAGHRSRGVIIPAELLPLPVPRGDDVLATESG